MSGFLRLAIAVSILCSVIAGSAFADRLILIPTATSLGPDWGLKAEYAQKVGDSESAYWLNLSLSRVEVEVARFDNFSSGNVYSVSGQVNVLSESTVAPAISLGCRDIGDKTTTSNSLYGGRSFYVTASKGIPITGGIPLLFTDMHVHAGLGTDSLSGLFLGVEGRTVIGVRLAAEYDNKNLNYGLYYDVVPHVRVSLTSRNGDIFYGAMVATKF